MEELMSALNVDQLSGLLAGGVLGMFVGGFLVLQIGYYILNTIGCWKVYNKLGEPGWKCLIPVYGTWVEYKYTWKPVMAFVIWGLSIAGEVMTQLAAESTPLWYAGIAVSVIGWIFIIIGYHKLSKAFGRGAGFTVGLVLFTGLFQIILGFGKSEYFGKPSDDQ